MKTVRCFLAVNLELKTAVKISELQQNLIEESRGFQTAFRWVPPQNMHITVRFLGNITEPMIQAIKDRLSVITRESAPVQIQAGAIGVFDPESPRILYCGIDDPSGALNELVTQVHEGLVNIGFKETEKPYVPHVTLARLDNADPAEMKKLTETFAASLDSVFNVRALVCYQSDLSSSGVDYQLLWKLPLQKRSQYRSNESSDEPESDQEETPLTSADSQSADDTLIADEPRTANDTEASEVPESVDTNVADDGEGAIIDDNSIGSESAEQGEQK